MGVQEGMLLEVTLRQTTLWGEAFNVFAYDVTAGVGEVEGVALAEAWWNYVKDEYRGIVRATASWLFSSVQVREVNNPAGVLVEWNIPTGEQQGTRGGVTESEFLPPFNAAAFRMTVATRATRPGQKRIGGLLEVDSNGGVLQSGYLALLDALAAELCEVITLAAPALTFNLTPSVFRKDAAGVVTAHQPVVGYVVNQNVTSQVSRKPGRGI